MRISFSSLLCISFIFSFTVLRAQDKTQKRKVQTIFRDSMGSRTLAERWELEAPYKRSTFTISPYKPMSITAGRWSNSPNKQPYSENPAYSATTPVEYQKYEAKYQISFKVKAIQGVFFNQGDLWIAYSQKSHWQIYNEPLSRPFRETNYEPEIILNFATNFPFLGFKGKMFGISFNHQSNGRSLPYSRSWNRIIAHVGFERKKWDVVLRGWYRLHDDDDENPAITDYIGRADGLVIFKPGKHMLSLTGTHTLRFDSNNRGFIQLDWVFPIIGNLKGNVQLANGYGETMIDYNHKQTLIAVGISLVEWL